MVAVAPGLALRARLDTAAATLAAAGIATARVDAEWLLAGVLGEADVRGQLRGVGKPATVLREQLAKLGLSVGVLGENTLARDLGDVGRLEVDL